MVAAPSTEWREQIAPDEDQRFLEYAELLRELQRRVDTRGVKGRALHRKAHLGAEATFTVAGDLPAEARAGLAAAPATYKAYVRFSNGGPKPLGDVMRARNVAYRLSTQERGVSPEPDGTEQLG